MTSRDPARRRPRRIAADEAHAWARNLRLGNHHAKSVLRSLTLYVDGDGFCFVGVDQLAEDCELSADTVRRRLVWLEEIGAVARRSQWLDASGVRNGEGRGKRTSDLIRLLTNADVDDIEARARGDLVPDSPEETTVISPSSQRGLNPVPDPLSPTPALRQPLQSCEGLISEPEPEPSPSPSRGRESAALDSEDQGEPEHFFETWLAYPGHEAMDRRKALAAFLGMTPQERIHARSAVPLYAEALKRLGRRSVTNCHSWLRERRWMEFPNALRPGGPLVEPEGVWIAEGSEADRALKFLGNLARAPARFVHTRPDGSRGYYRTSGVGADAIAMLQFAEETPLHWPLRDRGTPQCAAWQARFVEWVGKPLGPRIGEDGIRLPCPWPPKKDGTIYRDEVIAEVTDDNAGDNAA